jgi:hypothetical protein
LVRAINPSDDEMEQALLDVLRAVNTTRCRPPLPDDEVRTVYRNALKYRREDTAAEALFPGVEAIVEGSRTVHRPAGLELTIHQGDPTMFELRCDELRPFNPSGAVRVPAEVWGDARKMKTALIAAFPGVPFDRHPGDFAKIWDGTAPQAATRNHPVREAVTGLRVLLEQEAIVAGRRVEVTDAAENTTRRLVALFIEVLNRWGDRGPARCEIEKEDVDENEIIIERCGKFGGWVYGRLVFVWHTAWDQISGRYRTEHKDEAKLSAAIRDVIGRKLEQQRIQHRGERYVYRSLSAHEVEMLRDYAAGGATPASAPAWGGDDVSPGGQERVAGVAATQENAL